jgi:hypothetical protein
MSKHSIEISRKRVNVNFCMISAEYQRQRANEFDKVKDVVGNFSG